MMIVVKKWSRRAGGGTSIRSYLYLINQWRMHVEAFRDYCLSKPAVTESFPFGPDTLVFKVMDKMFALTTLDSDRFTVNLKCKPELAIEWREFFPEIRPGYHMNKRHWNTVDFDGLLEDEFLRSMIDLSYQLVVDGLPRSTRDALKKWM